MQVSFTPRHRRNSRSSVRSRWTALGLSALLVVSFFATLSSNNFTRVALADTTAQPLPFTQDWSNTGLITTDNDWSGVPGVIGYRGDDLGTGTATNTPPGDPQLIVVDLATTPVSVLANRGDPNTEFSGGVYEFDRAPTTNPTVALNGSSTADAPHIVLSINTAGRTGINVSYNVRDLDSTADNSEQQVALQFRVGSTGNYTNVPAGFVADATIASSATRVTAVNATLPAAADDKPVVQVRVITANAIGSDEAIGIDDISITGTTAGGGNPSGTGAATPNPVVAGTEVLLTVTVTSGSNPASTGLMVTGNLSSVGGAAAQQFFNDGTNGDATAGDNVFSYRATVNVNTTPGSKSIPVVIKDAQNREGSTSIALAVNPPPAQVVTINQIQGDALASPLVDRDVTTTAVVTALKSNGFFLQMPDVAGNPDADANPNTSEGVFVFAGGVPTVTVGSNVTVTGKVVEFNGLTQIALSGTATVNSQNNTLPAAVTLTPEILNSGGTTTQLERFEGMRLRADSLTTIAPSDRFGEFYTVLSGQPRPLREPGIDVGDLLPTGAPASIPRFDKNPERLLIDSDGQAGATKLEVTSNVTITNPTGVLDYSFNEYKLIPYAPLERSANMSARPVPQADANELTLASMNITFFKADPTPLAKASLAIRNVLRTPDVIGLQEIRDLASLQTLATRVNTDATAAGQPNPNYQAFLLQGNNGATQNAGYLIKSPRVSILETPFQIGKTEMFTDPNDNGQELLFDRPPLVTRIAVTNNGATLNVTVINNHLLSLITIEGNSPSSFRGRAKRKAQAEFLANYIQGLQTANPTENISLIGDFNAYQFNDGYVDVIGTIIGTPTPASRVTVASTDLVNPDFFALINELAPQERYSFYFDGSSGDPDGNEQALDHILVNDDLRARLSRHVYARNNADFYESLENDATRPERVSDHDNPVAYFRINTGASTSTLQFEEPTYTVSENARTINVNVTRTGDTAQAATVDYISNDLLALFNCNPVNPGQYEGTATSRCDYSTAAGTLNFAAGQTSLLITLIITNDVHAEGNETFSVSLRNNTGAATGTNVTATVTITDDDASNGTTNPINDNTFFVRQQYYDFFGRNPADSEVQGWVNAIQPDCGLQQDCFDRIWVSGKGFFFSTEFQLKGDFVYRFYRVGLGRMPTYNEFVPDLVRLKDTTDATKQEFATRFTEREEFRRIYDGLTNDQFVDELERRAGIAIANKAQLKADLTAGTRTRVQVVRAVAESQEVETRFFNESWVAMQYFGYLRRDFSTVEFNGWLRVLNANPNDYRTMVNGFINSIEYRQRFGQP